MLQGSSLRPTEAQEIIAAGEANGKQVLLEGHHTGISIALRYAPAVVNHFANTI
jgi:hypothetical protein